MPKTNSLATKAFVKNVVGAAEGKLRYEIEKTEEKLRNEIEKTEDKLHQEMKKNHNEVMEKLDSIVGLVQKFDEEHTLLSYRVSEHSDQLEEHEERIKKVEEKILPTSV